MPITPQKPAFTLIESVLIMVILATALSGAMYLIATLTQSIGANKKRIQATYLAQECVELTRNARDSAWRQNLKWTEPFPDLTSGKSYTIESNDKQPSSEFSISASEDLGITLNRLNYPEDSVLYLQSGKYTHESSDEKTIYSRTLSVKDIKKDDEGEPVEATFRCEVSWEDRGDPSVAIDFVLTDWKP
jgi:type II secretory pathway pseudopilin PulG